MQRRASEAQIAGRALRGLQGTVKAGIGPPLTGDPRRGARGESQGRWLDGRETCFWLEGGVRLHSLGRSDDWLRSGPVNPVGGMHHPASACVARD